MSRILIVIIALSVYQPFMAGAAEKMWSISAEEWARPRSGYSLSQMGSLQATIDSMNNNAGSLLILQYPGGEVGALWVSELKDWLVSLGVPSSRIRTRPGQSSHEIITLMLQ